MKAPKLGNFKVWLAIMWLLTTLSLAIWWMMFSLDLLTKSDANPEVIRPHQTMLAWEGATWILLLLGGGACLIYFVRREDQRFSDYVRFISAYNHDAKTTLMNIMLQSERLKDQNEDAKLAPTIDRLRHSVVRLRTQIENSLYLSNQKEVPIHYEQLSFREFVQSLSDDYPQIDLSLGLPNQSDLLVDADRKALESIFRNLVENSILHGKAKRIAIEVTPAGKNHFLTTVSDDGVGFLGDHRLLGKPFRSALTTAGSGLGLYLVKFLTQKMRGDASIKLRKGLVPELVVEISLQGRFV